MRLKYQLLYLLFLLADSSYLTSSLVRIAAIAAAQWKLQVPLWE